MTEQRDPAELRAEMIAGWERAAQGWGRAAGRVRETGMPVSAWMVDQLHLQPAQRVLDLAAGPGDTGFLAAELVRPGGMLISSDAAEAMVEVARARAREMGIDNVEFRRLELEWIDLQTASVDAVLCRWALMLTVDPAAALRECRRVLKSGGRLAVAVWDRPERNPWATAWRHPMTQLGHMPPPDPTAPGMFALAAPGQLEELLADAGFTEIGVESLELPRSHPSVEAYLEEQLDLSQMFVQAWQNLSDDQRAEVTERVKAVAAPFTAQDGSVTFPAASLVAAASA